MAEEDGFAWKGAPRPTRSGGFVDGVGVNTPLSPLAIGPEAPAASGRTSERVAQRVGGVGPNLDLERMEPGGEGDSVHTRRNGRVRLPR